MILNASDLTRSDLKHLYCSDRRVAAEIQSNGKRHHVRTVSTLAGVDTPRHQRTPAITISPDIPRLAG